jgi:hypothetical protein
MRLTLASPILLYISQISSYLKYTRELKEGALWRDKGVIHQKEPEIGLGNLPTFALALPSMRDPRDLVL